MDKKAARPPRKPAWPSNANCSLWGTCSLRKYVSIRNTWTRLPVYGSLPQGGQEQRPYYLTPAHARVTGTRDDARDDARRRRQSLIRTGATAAPPPTGRGVSAAAAPRARV